MIVREYISSTKTGNQESIPIKINNEYIESLMRNRIVTQFQNTTSSPHPHDLLIAKKGKSNFTEKKSGRYHLNKVT